MNGNGRRDLVSLSVLAVLALPAPLVAQVGSEFRVNSYTTGEQGYKPGSIAIAGTPATFVVVWEDPAKDGSSYGIFGQRYASSGAPQGGEFEVNTTTDIAQTEPSVAFAGGGGSAVVVWRDAFHDASGDIYGQRYSGSGAPLGGEFRVTTYAVGG